jgi:hypothetical protein
MLEELLDAAVSQTIELQLERGGQPLIVQLPVIDLHRVTPNAMLELAGGSVHALSYQQARNNRAVVGQVYVAEVRVVLVLFVLLIDYGFARKPTSDWGISLCGW